VKNEVLGNCPVCAHELNVTELSCGNCGTKIKGDFQLCKFCKLNKEQKYFAEVFIKNRGNIKDIEKELGVSYPTVKRMLGNVIEALGYKEKVDEVDSNKMDILEKLNKGEIDPKEALNLLK
jgi:hypothetical protein